MLTFRAHGGGRHGGTPEGAHPVGGTRHGRVRLESPIKRHGEPMTIDRLVRLLPSERVKPTRAILSAAPSLPRWIERVVNGPLPPLLRPSGSR